MLSVIKANFKIAGSVFLAVMLVQGATAFGQTVLYKGKINTFKLNIRTGPSRDAEVITAVAKGQVLDVVDISGGVGGWVTVLWEGQRGYVRNRPQYIILKPVKASPKTDLKVVKKARKKAPSDTGEETRKDQAASQKESRQIKEQIKEQIKAQEERVKDYSDKELEIIEGLNEIDYALNRARIKVSQLSAEIKTLEDKIIRLSTQKEELKTIIAQNRDYTGQRLKALYKMNMIGRLDAAGMPSSVFDFFLRQNAMKRIIQTDFDILEKQNTDFETLKRLEASLKVEKAAKTGLESELTDQIRINKSETLKKELILKEIRKKKKLSLAAVDALRDAEIRLETRIKRLQAGDTSPDQGLSFSSYKGRLKAPAQGRIISRFGPSKSGDDKSFTFQTGIDIKVERGEPVKSVFKGEVIFAEWLKGYGNVLIINHGDHYYTLYAHLEELFKRQGETVETGEVIATAGDTGSIKGTCLHFEVRHYGKPVNPLKWLNKGA